MEFEDVDEPRTIGRFLTDLSLVLLPVNNNGTRAINKRFRCSHHNYRIQNAWDNTGYNSTINLQASSIMRQTPQALED